MISVRQWTQAAGQEKMGLACFNESKLLKKEKGHIWENLGRDGMGRV